MPPGLAIFLRKLAHVAIAHSVGDPRQPGNCYGSGQLIHRSAQLVLRSVVPLLAAAGRVTSRPSCCLTWSDGPGEDRLL